MIFICIFLVILLSISIGYIIYLLLPPSKNFLYEEEFRRAANEIREKLKKEREEQVRFQSEQIQKEIDKMESIISIKAQEYQKSQEEWAERVQNLKDSYNRQKEEITSSLQEHSLKEQQLMTKQLLDKQKQIDKDISSLNEKYQITIADYENKIFEAKCRFENEEKILNEEIDQRKKEISTLIEQFKKDEEARKEADFYRIPITSAAKNDIDKLKGVAAQLNNPTVLYKLIWETYYKIGFDQMIGRVLGKNAEKSGVYKITNIKNQMCYIGQAANIKVRWRTHCRRAVKAEEGTSNRLYQIMWEEGLENFTFQVVEFCDRDKLTEREKFFIDFFQAKNYGYNSKN
jgi:hypothetical protein